MAAPTNPRVEATSITTTVVRWTYSGANYINVYRSTDGVSFAAITSFTAGTAVATGTTSYTDTGLSVATKYWYKLTDDSGSTFSSTVTVITHSCVGPLQATNGPVTLPRFDAEEVRRLLSDTSDVPGLHLDEEVMIDKLNEMARRVEAAFQGLPPETDQCIACPTDGAVVVDCSNGCNNWLIIADQDINSVSINWCDIFDGTIDFVVPPNTTVGICGLPAGFNFSGDECFQAKISGGANGRTVGVSYGGGKASGGSTASSPGTGGGIGKGSGAGGGGGGAGGGSGCTCVPNAGNLTIKSCNANNSLNCGGTKSLKLLVCGGRGPYTWDSTGDVILSADSGTSTTVTPPANPGSAEAGVAYTLAAGRLTTAGCTQAALVFNAYGCNDAVQSPECRDGSSLVCSGGAPSCQDGGCTTGLPTCNLPDYCPGGVLIVDKAFCSDERTAGMIAAGCNPCGVVAAGATVSVTDSLGTVATIIVRP